MSSWCFYIQLYSPLCWKGVLYLLGLSSKLILSLKIVMELRVSLFSIAFTAIYWAVLLCILLKGTFLFSYITLYCNYIYEYVSLFVKYKVRCSNKDHLFYSKISDFCQLIWRHLHIIQIPQVLIYLFLFLVVKVR